ncbi:MULTISPECIES: thiamine pyrophosphate-dependent dehydrogenase E1 component subunit alpha [unclassified Paenibacillus]|uniref:thiamine pyrophosphate-dependent dehydrogenase E1 component subunit alpha n=1 Tax=unclassified Paenibacillus TaxID=185978 RepID=UPI000956007E|nr:MULTISPECIES: thiamine pyrophosphate-dependent dehydrogenase E1 component subunit alpha [unclassified Paenibacillus]ASS65054.1 thiamine pyrophosphate-dependent dehydrogenase E1 component subunit alpha [Paenibacillus sp. RUD330]SIQ50243.1 2-oxoisovalerate dehydrogenase E1 component alpha subunit [Paenibacillus sp. RU4X]SIQ72178.1 2-oxoisovalerate dehydrogenase E1 component alpha subunit [Paenibacillus sp. RU4T]
MNQPPVGSLARHRELGLSDEDAVQMYAKMRTARMFDERVLLLQRAGKINFHVSGIGQEAAQVAAAWALDRDQDYFLPYYRDYGFVLSVGMTLRELMLSVFAKAEDPTSGGRQMPGHFGHKRLRIVTGSSPVTTQVPHAVGIALAAKMKGEQRVSFVTFGEGSSNQGDFHEGCNFAGVHKLPVILMCENNQYAISVPVHKQLGGKVADRAIGYGFTGLRVDGNDPLAVYGVVKEAHRRALAGEGPTLVEAMMYRVSPHSTSDNDLAYRTKEEVDENRAKDGVLSFRQYLIDAGAWSVEKDEELTAAIRRELDEATKYADEAPFPEAESTLLHVYADGSEGGK